MKKFATTILAFSFVLLSFGQTSMSFPAWVPNSRLFFGLPGISGIHVHVNNKLSYNEIFTKENANVLLDIDKGISNLQGQNMTSFHVDVNLFHVGFQLPAGATISLFANERVEADVLYPKQVIDFVWKGNDAFLDEEVKLGKLGVSASHFREYGIGFAYSPTKQLDIGLRAKYLVGFLNVSTPSNAKANVKSSGQFFQLDGELSNAQLRTSGLDIYDGGDLGSHLIMNGNTGFAIDLGGEYKLNKYYSVSGSILDLGWINWKENVVNQTLNDTTFVYSGINLEDVGDIQQTLEDSLINRFDFIETNETYKTWLPIKAYGSWIYHYDDYMDFYGSLGVRYIQGQFKMMYGGGITRDFGKIITLSASAMKLPQQFVNLGAAFVVKGGPVQLYMAADQVINFSAPDFKAIDFRVGINIKFPGRDFGLKSNSSITSHGGFGKNSDDGTLEGPKGVDTGAFLGKEVKTKKRDEIYSIIAKQKKPEVKKGEKEKKKVIRGGKKYPTTARQQRKIFRKSLNGRSGRKNANQ
jgi:hypothetical protein